jgi:hypothetical protein
MSGLTDGVPANTVESARRRERRRRKYLSLGTGELAAVAVFALIGTLVSSRVEPQQSALAFWSALVPLLVVLTQAGIYWLLARTWVEQKLMPSGLASIYRAFRILDVALLITGAVGVALWWPVHLGVALASVAILAFGVVEYLNYFVVRLAYPLRHWRRLVGQRRTPQLILDLRAAGRIAE